MRVGSGYSWFDVVGFHTGFFIKGGSMSQSIDYRATYVSSSMNYGQFYYKTLPSLGGLGAYSPPPHPPENFLMLGRLRLHFSPTLTKIRKPCNL